MYSGDGGFFEATFNFIADLSLEDFKNYVTETGGKIKENSENLEAKRKKDEEAKRLTNLILEVENPLKSEYEKIKQWEKEFSLNLFAISILSKFCNQFRNSFCFAFIFVF